MLRSFFRNVNKDPESPAMLTRIFMVWKSIKILNLKSFVLDIFFGQVNMILDVLSEFQLDLIFEYGDNKFNIGFWVTFQDYFILKYWQSSFSIYLILITGTVSSARNSSDLGFKVLSFQEDSSLGDWSSLPSDFLHILVTVFQVFNIHQPSSGVDTLSC